MVAALLRRLRLELPLVSTVSAIVLVTSFVFAAAPRAFNAISEDGLRYGVSQAAVYERNVVASRADRIAAASGGDPFGGVDAAGGTFQASLAPSIQALIDHRTYVVDAPSYRFLIPPGTSSDTVRHVTLRYQSGIDAYTKLVRGRLPAPTTATVAPPPGAQTPTPVIEVAMTESTATTLGVKLGERVVLEPDPEDRLIPFGRGNAPGNLAIELVAFVQVLKPDDAYWYADTRLQQASVYDDGNQVQIYATALFAPQTYADLLNDTRPADFNYQWRYYVSPDRFHVNDVAQLRADVHRLDASYGSTFTSRARETGVTTRLSDILQRFAEQQRLSGSILSLVAIGLLTVAAAVIGLLAAFIAERRREMVALLRGRGGSARQILGAQAVEGLLLSVPAAGIGYLLARLLVRSEPTPWTLYAAAGIAAITSILLVAAAAPFARRNLRALEREEIRPERFSMRRAALEAFVVVLAGTGIYLLRRRGLAGDASTAASGGFDPYLAAVPVLLGLATGLATLRLYPLPIRLLAWAASFRSDLVPFIGLRRISRQSVVTAVPLLVLLLSVAIAVLSSVMLDTIATGQVRTSWERVGADFRVDALSGSQLDPSLDLSTVPGVTAMARAYQDTVVASSLQVAGGLATLFAVQPAAYQTVAAGTPVDPRFPPELLAPISGPAPGTGTNPLPAIISSNSPTSQPLGIGDTFALQIQGQAVTFVVREIRPRFPGLLASTPFVVASYDGVAAADPTQRLGPTTIFLKAPESAAPAIQAALDDNYVPGSLTSRAETYREVHDAPLIAGAVRGFRLGIAIAAIYSALAVVLGLTLTGKARARDLGYLRTLGLSPRQVLGLTVAEQAPPLVLALVLGTALGIAIIRLIEPGLDFTAFTGPDVPVRLEFSRTTIALLWIGLVVVVAVAVAAVSAAAERMNLSGVLRLGER